MRHLDRRARARAGAPFAQPLHLLPALLHHHFEVGGIECLFAIGPAVMRHQPADFLMQGDKCRIHFHQFRFDAGKLGFQFLRRHPNRQHFQSMKPRLRQMPCGRLNRCILRARTQAAVQLQPTAQVNGFQPFFIVLRMKQMQEDIAQVIQILKRRHKAFIDSDTDFACKTAARKNAQADQGRINMYAAQPLVKTATEQCRQFRIPPQHIQQKVETLPRAPDTAPAQKLHQRVEYRRHILFRQGLGQQDGQVVRSDFFHD